MSDTTPDSVLNALRWRYATKTFDATRKIPQDLWSAIEESLVLTPSSFGLQPWKFFIIENPTVRAELRGHSWGQTQITDASHLVVLTARTDVSEADIETWVARLSEVQGTPREVLAPLQQMIGGFVGNLPADARQAWNIRQVYIALGQLMTTAALLGVDSCPMEGIDPKAYDQILGLADSGYTTAVVCALGYRSAEDTSAKRPKARYAADAVITTIR